MGLELTVEPLTEESFAPFGEVLTVPHPSGRAYFGRALANLRPSARASLSLARKEDVASLPLLARQMERHEFSSQSFVPVDAGRYLVLVAPHAAGGGPDMTKARAFVAAPGQGITYGANVWHHPLTIFDRPAAFAIYMWLEGGKGDEEFFTLPTPVRIDEA
jgi:ureidoglycolate lyase